MPVPTAADLFMDYPGVIDNEPPVRVDRTIQRVVAYLDESDWQPKHYPLAVAYLTLHWLVSTPTPKPVTSTPISIPGLDVDVATVKQVEVYEEFTLTFHSPKDMGASSGSGGGVLTSTKWGLLFLELQQLNGKRASWGIGAPSVFDQPIW